jgi:hypothetical protein
MERAVRQDCQHGTHLCENTTPKDLPHMYGTVHIEHDCQSSLPIAEQATQQHVPPRFKDHIMFDQIAAAKNKTNEQNGFKHAQRMMDSTCTTTN